MCDNRNTRSLLTNTRPCSHSLAARVRGAMSPYFNQEQSQSTSTRLRVGPARQAQGGGYNIYEMASGSVEAKPALSQVKWVPAAILGQAVRLPPQPRGAAGFTLGELLVSVGVLVLLVFLATQLINSATTVAILGHKRMDADSEARQVLDRMTIDFAQMVKRTDMDYYVKLANQQRQKNDQ